MIKFIITAVVIYFIVRSIANKPWQAKQIHIHHNKTPNPNQSSTASNDEDYVEYEEVE